MVAAGAGQVCGFIMNGQKSLRLGAALKRPCILLSFSRRPV